MATTAALLAVLLPAAAGVALGHTASSTCDSITLSNSSLNANIYVYGTYTGGSGSGLTYHYGTGTLVMTVAGNHTYTIAAGDYQVVWTDGVKSGDLSVGKCPSTITTVASPSTGTAGVAMTVGDTATLHAQVTYATGTSVTFTLYNSTCTTSTGVSGSGSVNGSGIATYSTSWTPSVAGTYHWKASFPGDAYNSSYVSGCGDANETVTVDKASPTIATTLSKAKGSIGDAIHDGATLTGATSNAGGQVTYTVYTNTTCTAGAQNAGTKTVSGGSVPNSDAITFNNAGTWYWKVVYSGDANNNGATSTCTSETLVIDPSASPSSSASPSHSANPSPSSSPFQSFQGATATPFQSIQGATATPATPATPPPTNSSGDGSSNNSTPLFALLISLMFGGLGLAAVQAQRRSIRN